MKLSGKQIVFMQEWLDVHDVDNPRMHLDYFSGLFLLKKLGADVAFDRGHHKISNIDEIPECIEVKDFSPRYLPGARKFISLVTKPIKIT